MSTRSRRAWIALLRAEADRAPRVDGRTLALGGMEQAVRDALRLPPADDPGPDDDAAETRLWRARGDAALDVSGIALRAGDGAILEQGAFRAIETWTDAELSALHALWWIARDRGRPDLAARLDRARAWHLEHTQPDNATNRPWAVHLFALAGTAECDHYAETLLHDAIALEGRPTALGGVLLHDAAEALAVADADPR